MKKSESPKKNKNIFTISTIFAVGLVSLNIFEEKSKEIYYSKKSGLESKLEKLVGNDIKLGDYVGLKLFGLILKDTKVIDQEENKLIVDARNISIKIMPIKSILNRKWIFSINPHKLAINVPKEIFKRRNILDIEESNKGRYNYEFYLNLKNRTFVKIDHLGIKRKLKGQVIYRSKQNQIISFISSSSRKEGLINIKFNKQLKDEFLSLKIKSRNFSLKDSFYEILNDQIYVNSGILNSNINYFKSSKKTYCLGKSSFDEVNLKTLKFSENIKTESIKIKCNNDKVLITSNFLNYGNLISNIRLDIPFKNNINNINIIGELGYIDSPDPEIKLNGNIPYRFSNKGIKFGILDTNFILNRTQLSNLNLFRKNGIRGFITAKGKVRGELDNLKTLIDFNIDYPHYKGIRIREIWDGKITNNDKGYLLKMNNRYSPIPSFLSIKIDSKLKPTNLDFIRIFDSNKGSFNIVRNKGSYLWRADNFPLNEIELSLQNNQFDRVIGTINGSGNFPADQSSFDGRFALSLGKYRNIKFANSLFQFFFKDNQLNINSSIYPLDGGMIDINFQSNKNNLFEVDFINISANWAALTTLDILNFNKNKKVSSGNSKDLKFIQIINSEKTLDQQLNYLKKSLKPKDIGVNRKRINNFLDKFEGRYNASLKIYGNEFSNYKINSKVSGFLKEKNNLKNPFKNDFSIDLNGGLFNSKGVLKVSRLPLSLGNLFFDKPKDLKGSLSIKLSYDLDKKNFSSIISSEQTKIKDFSLNFNKGFIDFNDSLLKLNLSIMPENALRPITLLGTIPIRKEGEIDLRLKGDQKFLELIGNLSNQNFSFNNGDANLRMLITGSRNKPIANGFLFIKDAEINIFKNDLKSINTTMIFDFDQVDIKSFNAIVNESGKLSLKGSLPFYQELEKNKKSINFISKDLKLIGNEFDFAFDSNMYIKGSFISPYIKGKIVLKNGFINLDSNNKKVNNNSAIKKEVEIFKTWPELYWLRDKEIEIISNESFLNRNLFNENLPDFFGKVNFDNLFIKLGPDFRIEYGNILKVYLDTKIDLNLNGNLKNNLNARGLVDIKKGRANLYTTPFKLNKNKDNYILFASRNGITPYLDFSLTSKVPDTIIPISENNKDTNLSNDLNAPDNSKSFGAFGVGNTRFIKIEASYNGFLDQLSFEDRNQKIKLRSSPSYSRSQIIGLIGGNSSNLINRAFISQLNGAEGFNERLQLSLYPALIENNDSGNNIFSSETLTIGETQEESINDGMSSQAWIAEIGFDITDSLNFAMQATPNRDDIPPLWILTLQANDYLEFLGSVDAKGEWKSQFQLFFRY